MHSDAPRTTLLATAVLVTLLLLSGCTEEQGPAEETGEQIDEAAEEFGDDAGEAAEKAGDAVEDAGDSIEDATDQ